MCNRYEFNRINRLYDELEGWLPPAPYELDPRPGIAPSTSGPIIRATDAGGEIVQARWGLVPFWSKAPKVLYATFNARSNTVEKLASFREPFRKRRCLIPATAWFEYQTIEGAPKGVKKPMWRLWLDHGQDFAIAGLWDRWNGRGHLEGQTIESYTMVMTSANAKIAAVHDRMPVILDRKDYRFWLDREIDDVPALKALLVPAADDRIVMERLR